MWMSYSRELCQVDSPCSAKQDMFFKAVLYILESYRLEKTIESKFHMIQRLNLMY